MGLGMQRDERRLWDQLTGLVGYIWGDEKITFQRLLGRVGNTILIQEENFFSNRVEETPGEALVSSVPLQGDREATRGRAV